MSLISYHFRQMIIGDKTSLPYGRKLKQDAYKRDLMIKAITALISLTALKCFNSLSLSFAIPFGELFVRYKHKRVILPAIIISLGLWFCSAFNPSLIDPIRKLCYFTFITTYLTFNLYVILKVIERLIYGKSCYLNAHKLLD